MKLLTLNTHSLIEKNYRKKLVDFVNGVSEEQPDIIALQEVNQSVDAKEADVKHLSKYHSCDKATVIREDNHVLNAVRMLEENGVGYYWTWLPIKNGYGRYEEGIALMSRSAITKTKVITVSAVDDYSNWKTRKIIGTCTAHTGDEWFFSVHYGWWNDEKEPFCEQWKRTVENLPNSGEIWLMGDFNNPAQARNEGYDMVAQSGFSDSYRSAKYKDEGTTAKGTIDGWKDKKITSDNLRIDQIWYSKRADISSCNVIFNGMKYPVVSDHYGVIVECEENLQ